MDEQMPDARYYLGRALEWIDAIPKDIADSLPAMPGFDRDLANAALSQPAAQGTQEPNFPVHTPARVFP